MTDLRAQLTLFISDRVVQEDGVEINGTTELLLDGIVDSLGVVQIVNWLEEHLGQPVDPGDVTIDHFGSIDQMVEFAERSTPPS